MKQTAQPPPQATQGPIAAPAAPPMVQEPPAPEPEESFTVGEYVFSPYSHGCDVIFQVVAKAGPLTFVIGDVFERPTPLLTAHLQSVQDHIVDGAASPASPPGPPGGEEAVGLAIDALRRIRQNVIRTAKIRTANDEGILRLQMAKEGIDRLGNSLQEAIGVGIAGTALWLTYTALKGLIEKMLKERVQSKEQRRDYEYQNDLYFHL